MNKSRTPPPTPDDAELSAWFSAHAALLDLYRALPLSEPPARLDAAILAGARHAARHQSRRPSWWLLLASAASLVAAAGIGWRVYLAESGPLPSAPAPSAPAHEVFEVDLYPASEREQALETAIHPPAPAEAQAAAPKAVTAPVKASPAAADLAKANTADEPRRDRAAPSELARRPAALAEPFTSSDHASLGRAPEQRAASGLSDRLASPAAVSQPGKSEAKQLRTNQAETAPSTAAPTVNPTTAAEELAAIEVLLADGEIVAARRAIRAFRSRYPDHPLPAAWRRYER